jgi:DNA-binding transcriptional LysR family regulator
VDRFDRYCGEMGVARTRLRLSSEVLGGTWEALVDRRADIAIGAPGDAPAGSRIRSRPLAEVEMVFAVAPGHPLAAEAEPLNEATIAEHRIVVIADTSRVTPPRTIGLIEGQETLTVCDMPGKLAAQLAGLGCGWLPRFLVSPHATAGALIVKRVVDPRKPVAIHSAWNAERPGKALAWWLKALDDGRWAAMLAR